MQENKVYMWAAPLLAISWLSIVLLNAGSNSLVVGCLAGSLFSHPTVAAAWAAFGPGKLSRRLPGSLLWVLIVGICFGMNILIFGGPGEAAIIVGACLFAQWLLVLILFSGLAGVFGVRLQHTNEATIQNAQDERLRFGIRHLLIVMVVSSILLGIGRVVAPNIAVSEGPALTIAFLVFAAIVVTFPLLLAVLIRHYAVVGIVLSLGLITIATAVELPLLQAIGGAGGPATRDFIAINVVSTLFILTFTGIVRLNGFSLYARPRKDT